MFSNGDIISSADSAPLWQDRQGGWKRTRPKLKHLMHSVGCETQSSERAHDLLRRIVEYFIQGGDPLSGERLLAHGVATLKAISAGSEAFRAPRC